MSIYRLQSGKQWREVDSPKSHLTCDHDRSPGPEARPPGVRLREILTSPIIGRVEASLVAISRSKVLARTIKVNSTWRQAMF